MSTTFVIKCSSCGWDKFNIIQQDENVETTTVYLEAECDRCYKPISGVVSPGEIRFNYEKRIND